MDEEYKNENGNDDGKILKCRAGERAREKMKKRDSEKESVNKLKLNSERLSTLNESQIQIDITITKIMVSFVNPSPPPTTTTTTTASQLTNWLYRIRQTLLH